MISTLNNMKGLSLDELKRSKERARKTMKLLNSAKKVETAQEKSLKAAAAMNATTLGGQTSGATSGESPIDILLFGGARKNQALTSSMGATVSSNYLNTVYPLKQILRQMEIIDFEIAAEGDADLKPINKQEEY